MGEETLEHTMRICIEEPDHLTHETLEDTIENYKKIKRKIALHLYCLLMFINIIQIDYES